VLASEPAIVTVRKQIVTETARVDRSTFFLIETDTHSLHWYIEIELESTEKLHTATPQLEYCTS
jgi:hypothetical protein